MEQKQAWKSPPGDVTVCTVCMVSNEEGPRNIKKRRRNQNVSPTKKWAIEMTSKSSYNLCGRVKTVRFVCIPNHHLKSQGPPCILFTKSLAPECDLQIDFSLIIILRTNSNDSKNPGGWFVCIVTVNERLVSFHPIFRSYMFTMQ